MTDGIETFIIDVVERIDDVILKKSVGHRLAFVQQIDQTVGGNLFKTILAGKKAFEYEQLSAGSIRFSEGPAGSGMRTGNPVFGWIFRVFWGLDQLVEAEVAVNQRTDEILLKLSVCHRTTCVD